MNLQDAFEDLSEGFGETGLPVLGLLLLVLLLIWLFKPNRLVVRLLGPATTPFAAGMIVFAVLLLAPAVFLTAMSLDIRVWISIPLAITAAGLCCTMAEADRSRYLDAARVEMAAVLDQMSRSLRVGMSLEQAVEQVAGMGEGPITRAMQRARHAAALGRDLPVVLNEQAERLGLPEFSALAALVTLHRGTGGSLSDRLAAQIVSTSHRRRAQSRLRLAAMQVTLQADILVVFLGVLIAQTAFMEPRNLTFLLETELGRQMLAGSICLAGLGWLTIWGLLRVATR